MLALLHTGLTVDVVADTNPTEFKSCAASGCDQARAERGPYEQRPALVTGNEREGERRSSDASAIRTPPLGCEALTIDYAIKGVQMLGRFPHCAE